MNQDEAKLRQPRQIMTRPVSAETRARISRGLKRHWERRRERERVRPRDLERLRSSGTVAESLRPLLEIAEREAGELLEALGGVDQVTAQRRAIVEDAVSVGIVLRAELARYLQSRDPDAAGRVGSLANSRRAALVAVGLDRYAREVSLDAYLAGKYGQAPQERAGRASAAGGGPVVEVQADRTSNGDDPATERSA